MSGSVNKVIIVGRLGKDPEVKSTAGGQAVAQLSVATDHSWTDKAGQRQEKTEWHRVVVWGRDAENAQKYLGKGRMVYVEGRLETREWQDKDGQRRFTTEVVAQQLTYLDKGDGVTSSGQGPRNYGDRGGGQGARAGGHAGSGGHSTGALPPAAPLDDDNLPF